jgi:hypothetical protein
MLIHTTDWEVDQWEDVHKKYEWVWKAVSYKAFTHGILECKVLVPHHADSRPLFSSPLSTSETNGMHFFWLGRKNADPNYWIFFLLHHGNTLIFSFLSKCELYAVQCYVSKRLHQKFPAFTNYTKAILSMLGVFWMSYNFHEAVFFCLLGKDLWIMSMICQ